MTSCEDACSQCFFVIYKEDNRHCAVDGLVSENAQWNRIVDLKPVTVKEADMKNIL